jgi:hypothetical protein
MDNETPASTEREPEETKAKVKQKKEKKTKASKAKSKAKATVAPPETPEQAQEPEQDIPPMRTLDDLYMEVLRQRLAVLDHTRQIAELQSRPVKKRIMAHGGKVQIRDKKTGTVYPPKNNTYQSMLKAGELKDLVDAGIFGTEPEKNNFGWFALVRAWPDRFEEVKTETETK